MGDRYKRLFHNAEEVHTIGSPVSVVGRALLWDNAENREIAQIKIKNLFAEKIMAVSVLIKTYDTARDFMGEIQYEYKDLLVNKYESFGEQIPIRIENDSVRWFDVYVSRVVYGSGEVWKSQISENYIIEDEVPLSVFLANSTLVEQYRLKYGTNARMVPLFYNDIWICTCGETNHTEEMICKKCKNSKERMLEDLNKDVLAENYRESQYAKAVDLYQKGGENNYHEACSILKGLGNYSDSENLYSQCFMAYDREKKEREYQYCVSNISGYDVQNLEKVMNKLSALGDYKDAASYYTKASEQLDILRKEENTKRINAEKKIRNKRILISIVGISIAILSIAVVVMYPTIIRPYIEAENIYRNATHLLETQRFDEAREEYKKLRLPIPKMGPAH